MISKVFFNRAPLLANRMAPLPVGAIRPEGWLKEELQIQAKGLTGKLYDIWPDVSKECAWLGGKGDAWERAPYYLDGLLPLAYILDDEELIKKANSYIEWMLASQREDGFFGPDSNNDWWPRMVALKALQQYFTATGDKRVLTFMDKYFRYELQHIDEQPLKEWAVPRVAENMLTVIWLYNVTGMEYLLKLLEKLRDQSLDWTKYFHNANLLSQSMCKQRPFPELVKKMDTEAPYLGNAKTFYREEYHSSHVVNVAMGLKNPGIINQFHSGFKEADAFRVGWDKLMKRHGVAYGMFTGDEHISGNDPVHGTELCAIVEAMFSLECLLGAITDFDRTMPDILEKLAFNALPAQMTKDMMARQYDQQANQIRSTIEPHGWYNNENDSNVYGFVNNFGCCTANLHQGWPKFVSSLWYATNDNGLAAISYAPCSVNFMAGGTHVHLKVETAYPFESSITVRVSAKTPAEFPLYLRIPSWADQAMIRLPDGEFMHFASGETACVRRTWGINDSITIDLPMEPRMTRWYHQSAAIEMGPLLMCFNPKEDWEKIRDDGVTADWQVTTKQDWNWALVEDEPMKTVMESGKVHAFKNGENAVTLLAKAVRLPDWQMNGANCDNPPIGTVLENVEPEVITLTPYGNSSLRISQFPTARIKK